MNGELSKIGVIFVRGSGQGIPPERHCPIEVNAEHLSLLVLILLKPGRCVHLSGVEAGLTLSNGNDL